MLKKCMAALMALLMIFLVGCGSKKENNTQETVTQDFPYTFTDSVGNQITLTKPPKKVAVLFSSYAQIWQLAGGSISVTVGDSVERGFADAQTPLVDDGAGMKIDVEALVAQNPDFVIASADMSAQKEACERLSEYGIPCAVFQEESFEDYLSILKIFTDITGNYQAYEEYGVQVKERVDQVLSSAKERAKDTGEVSVLFVRAGSGSSSTRAKTAQNHFVGVMLEELGAKNIADEAGALSEGLSLEYVLISQPDVILIVPQGDEEAAKSYMDSVLSQSGWRDLEAVKNNRYTYLSKDLFHYKPNQRWDEAYSVLADLLYPTKEQANG